MGKRAGRGGRDSPQSRSDKHKKKRKWRLFKKRKSTEEPHPTPKESRSHSDTPSEMFSSSAAGVALRQNKMRSISQDTYLERAVGGGGKGRRKLDRYTIYMQDYSMKLEERRKQSPRRDMDGDGDRGRETRSTSGSVVEEVDRASTDDGLDDRLGDATPPAEMTPQTFKESLFCNQLKFKLRSALQNMQSIYSSCSWTAMACTLTSATS